MGFSDVWNVASTIIRIARLVLIRLGALERAVSAQVAAFEPDADTCNQCEEAIEKAERILGPTR